MRRAALVAIVAAVAAALALAFGVAGPAAAEEPPYQFPLDGYVRAGRPVVVRIGRGGAARVRGGGSPWALPQGPAEEFVLQIPRADVTLRDLEVEDGRGAVRIPVVVSGLPAAGVVRAAIGPAEGARIVLRTEELPGDLRPRIPEAWLVADEVADLPSGIDPAIREAVEAWRAGPRAGHREAFQPLLHRPGPEAFRAAVALAAEAPVLPPAPARALVLLALVTAAVVTATRRRPGAARAAWLGVPALATLVWLAAAQDLTGGVRATMVWFDSADGPDRLVLLRLEARRDTAVSFRVPPEATTPALLRYDADDLSGIDAEIGREVRLPIPSGHSRLLAWRVPLAPGEGDEEPQTGPRAAPPEPVRAWLASLGLLAPGGRLGADPAAGAPLLDARGFTAVVVPGWRVAARK